MNVAELTAEVTALKARNAELLSQVERLRALYLQTLEQVKKLERGIIGPKSERLPGNDAQLTLDILAALLREQGDDPDAIAEAAQRDEVEHEERPKTKHKPAGRKPLPESLPRVEIEVLPPEVEQEGLAAFDRIGADHSETVERRPASMVVVRVVRPKFVRKGAGAPDAEVSTAASGETEASDGTTVVLVAEPPELPIPKGLAGPGLLADTIVRRWVDHTPLYRLESVYARDGLPLARSTVCTWHDAMGELVAPLVEAMFDDAMSAPYLCTDATGVLVQAREQCRRSHFWVLVAPERHVLFRYNRGELTEFHARPGEVIALEHGDHHDCRPSHQPGWRYFIKAMRGRGDPRVNAFAERGQLSWPYETGHWPDDPLGVFPTTLPPGVRGD